MRAALALLVACLAVASAELELQAIKEVKNVPGVTGGSYAIVQDGKVVGTFEHYRSEGPILGRRGGGHAVQRPPRGDAPPSNLGNLLEILGAHLDIFSLLQQQMLASRCPRARQMALLAAAHAAAAADTFPPVDGPFPMGGALPQQLEEPVAEEELMGVDSMQQKLFGGGDSDAAVDAIATALEEAEEAPAATLTPRDLSLPLVPLLVRGEPHPHPHDQHGGHMMRGGPHMGPHMMEAGGHMGPHPHPHPHMGPGFLPGATLPDHGPGAKLTMRGARPTWPEGLQDPAGLDPGLVLGVEGTSNAKWLKLYGHMKPMPEREPSSPWSVHDADGNLNWGLVVFVALAVACVAVWGAMLVQWVGYRSARAVHDRALFIASTDSDKLKPLLHEGPLDIDLSSSDLKKIAGGVEVAAAHVPEGQRIVTVLHYEPLKSSQ